MPYLMLVLFPPAGIIMCLTNRDGPPKWFRVLLSVISFIWMIFVICMIVRIPLSHKQQVDKIKEDIFYDSEEGKVTNKVTEIARDKFLSMSTDEKVDFIKKALGASTGDYGTISLSDGTGILFPGNDINETAWYGDLNEDGSIAFTYGEVTIKNGKYEYKPYPSEQIAESKFISEVPEKYLNDITNVKFKEKGDSFEINFETVLENPKEDDYKVIENLAKKYKAFSGKIIFYDSNLDIIGQRSF